MIAKTQSEKNAQCERTFSLNYFLRSENTLFEQEGFFARGIDVPL